MPSRMRKGARIPHISAAFLEPSSVTVNPRTTTLPISSWEKASRSKTIEGKKYHVLYLMAPSATNVQVARNFNTALRQANWTNDFMNDASTASTWHKNGT